MLQHVCDWLTEQSISAFVANTFWVIPMVQAVHILSLAVVFTATTIINLNLAGITHSAVPRGELILRLAPWVWRALGVMAVTGVLLILGEPARSLLNPVFQTKMALLVAIMLLTIGLHIAVARDAERFSATSCGFGVRALALLSLSLWFAIAVAGRWIAYVEHA